MKTLKKAIKISLILLSICLTNCSTDDIIDETPSAPLEVTPNTITLECDYNTDTILTNHSNGVDYIVDCQVNIDALVTIEPGTTIIFKTGTSLYVNSGGALSADGIAESPITFKGEQNIKGYWRGVGFESNDVRNKLNYVKINNAGSSPINSTWYNQKAAVVVFKTIHTGKLSIKNTIIENTDGIGLAVMNHITNYNSADLNVFSNNTFNNNSGAAVRVSAEHVEKIESNSTYTNNGFNGVSIRESKLDDGIEHIWQGIDYYIDGEIDIRKGIKILPGAKLQFSPNGFLVAKYNNAYINAVGTASENIIFTGHVTTPGSWKGIYILDSNNVQNKFSYCKISYGGSASQTLVSNKSNLTLFNGSYAQVTNCEISNSNGCGIIVGVSTITGFSACTINQSNNTFQNNVSNDFCDQG